MVGAMTENFECPHCHREVAQIIADNLATCGYCRVTWPLYEIDDDPLIDGLSAPVSLPIFEVNPEGGYIPVWK